MNPHVPSASRSDRPLQSRLDGWDALLRAMVHERTVEPWSDILRQGGTPTTAHLLLHGLGYRYRLLDDGRRQITAVLVSGDMCDLEAVMRGRADYGVDTLTTCVLGDIPAERIADPATLSPEMSRILWCRLLQDEPISREWLIGLGRRTALERVAHLLCELRVRVDAAEMFDMRFTHSELADVLGLSTVDINRTQQQLRRTGLIAWSCGVISLLNSTALERIAGFYPAYLQVA